MNIKQTFKVLTLALTLAAIASVSAPAQANALSGSEFDPANIVSDTVFFNGDTMNPNQIQAFLDAKVPVCDTWHAASGDNKPPFTCLKDYKQAVPTIEGDAYCARIGGNGTVYSAAQIIYMVSKACSINPQAMIVLLQKEQSLITDTWPFDIQYRSATGYGCPDTAACDTQYYGYFNQVYNAARQFNRYVQQPHLFNYAVGRTSFVSYQANRPECGGTNVTIQTKATAALYNYTPYQPNGPALANLYDEGDGCSAYGNRNFWRMFNDWFGSTHGDLARAPGDATVYLLSDNMKYPIASGAILNDYSALGPLRYVSDQYLATKTTGAVLGRMVQGPDGSLYLVNAGIRLPLSSCSGDVVDYGYTCAQGQFAPINLAQVNKLHRGPAVTKLIRSHSNATIYYMEGGKKRPIPSWGDLVKLNIPISINVFSDSFASQYPVGAVVHGPGALIKSASSGTVYVVANTKSLHPLTSFVYTQEVGLRANVRTISDTDFKTYTVSSTAFSNKISCNAANYVGVNGVVYVVNDADMAAYGYSSNEFIAGGKMCPNIGITTKQLDRYIRSLDGTIYYVNDSGQKQAFASMNSYVNHQSTHGNPGYIQVSDFFANRLSDGSNL